MNNKKKIFNTRNLVLGGLLVAASLILTRFFGFLAFGGSVRISLGGVPIALAGALLGPVAGGIVGFCADVVGATLFPQGAFFPGFTLTAILSGVIPGLFLYGKKISWSRVAFSQSVSTIICSLILNTLWLTIILQKGFLILLPTRVVAAVITTIIEIILMVVLLKSLDGKLTSGDSRAKVK